MNYLVTGATGLIGGRLVEQLLARPGTVHALVRRSSVERLERLAERLDARGRLVPVVGDLREPGLGVTGLDVPIDHMFHVAAAYDLEVSDQLAATVNMEGTRHAVQFANAHRVGRFHHTSSNGVAGRYSGVFTESMLDEGQLVDHPYFHSKQRAEQIVRAECTVPFRIYRPSVTVGDSRTGRMTKVDGAYHFFGAVGRMAGRLPRWLPLVGPRGTYAHLVPVDFVAAAMDHIAHLPDDAVRGDTFHLLDPDPVSVGEAVNVVARAAGAPQFRVLVGTRWTRPVARTLRHLPGARRLRDGLLRRIGIPPVVMDWRDFDAWFDTSNTDHALVGSGIACPPFASYAGRLYGYWQRELAPPRVPWRDRRLAAKVRGRRVLVLGASGGIGQEVSRRLGRAGATVLLLARREHELRTLEKDIRSQGGTAFVHPADLSDRDDVARVLADLLDQHDGVDVVVNSAGRSIRRSVAESYQRWHDYDRMMGANYFGQVHLCLGLLPGMRERGRGHLLTVSSIGLQAHMSRFSAYNPSKAALDAFLQSLAPEVAGDGVRITTLYMTLVRTAMSAPTAAFRRLPALDTRQAAALVCRALVRRKPRMSTAVGTVAQLLSVLAPRLLRSLMRAEYRMLSDTNVPAAGGKS